MASRRKRRRRSARVYGHAQGGDPDRTPWPSPCARVLLPALPHARTSRLVNAVTLWPARSQPRPAFSPCPRPSSIPSSPPSAARCRAPILALLRLDFVRHQAGPSHLTRTACSRPSRCPHPSPSTILSPHRSLSAPAHEADCIRNGAQEHPGTRYSTRCWMLCLAVHAPLRPCRTPRHCQRPDGPR